MTQESLVPTLGALTDGITTRFRIWAPKPRSIELEIQHRRGRPVRHTLTPTGDGYFEATVKGGPATRYGYVVDGLGPFPDPCSRSQPDGVHALSEVHDPATFQWTDQAWTRRRFRDLVIYEAHVGTFTSEGTFDSTIGRLAELRDLGVNALELMPVASFPGRRGWGYDGVSLFAPHAGYGGPDGLRRLVDAAHAAGIAVVLDVVYNHLGPDGNYLGLYSDQYFTRRHTTPWGEAVNFDDVGSEHVRRFFRENLVHWAREYHIDGFRLDATHAIFDSSPTHILAELSAGVRSLPHGGAPHYLIAESHENDVRYLMPRSAGGFGFDAVWADDFHHGVRTLLTHEREGYLQGFAGSGAQLAETASQGFFYEGQFDPGYGAKRGTKAREAPWGSFVYCIQNHDQVGNQAFGEPLATVASKANVRAATMLLLLLPQTPMLFQGQDWLSTTPFLYFSDHVFELGKLVTEGRRREFTAFRAFNDPATRHLIPDPQAEDTFRRSVLDEAESLLGPSVLARRLVKAAIGLRRRDRVIRKYRAARLPLTTTARGSCLVVASEADGQSRWLVANFGPARTAPVSLPAGARVLLSSNDSAFGGNGVQPEFRGDRLGVPGETCLFLDVPIPAPPAPARRPLSGR